MGYGDPMALAGKFAGTVAGILIVWVLALAGCQGQRAEAPAMRFEPAGNGFAGASSPEASAGAAALQTSNLQPPTSEKTPEGVTPNEAKKMPTEVEKPEPSGPVVELALKFVPGQATTYKITSEQQKSIEWKGSPSAKPAQFTDGRSGTYVELTFEQRVQQVQDDGGAVLEITIKGLKYVGEAVNKVVLDFDSTRQEDAGNPLMKLVGKGYQVKMSPKGQVVEISNVGPVRQAVQGSLPGHNVALRLLADDEIRSRHEIVALSALKGRSVRPGQTWSSIKTFSFDDLGAKTYERVYTLKPVQQSNGRLAVVEMKAIPSAALAEELYKRQKANPFAGMSDNTGSYEGRLVLDLDSGQIREYTEQMQNEWIIADPTSGQNPAAIRMAARRLHRLEQVP
jgi:hypothetical protein